MSIRHAIRAAKVLRIYCPLDDQTRRLVAAGNLAEIDKASALGSMLEIIGREGPLGDFGAYRSVVELSPGWELFTPGPQARPTLGTPGKAEISATAVLTVYMDGHASDADVAQAIDAIMAAHPWEVPVVELTETSLVMRA